MVYTLGEAAKAVGKSKATISKAIKNGKISAEKQSNGSYKIEPVELHRVYPPTLLETVDSKPLDTPPEIGVNTTDFIELSVKLKAAEQRIGDLEEDRDQWRQQANRLLTWNGNDTTKKKRPSFWDRFFS